MNPPGSVPLVIPPDCQPACHAALIAGGVVVAGRAALAAWIVAGCPEADAPLLLALLQQATASMRRLTRLLREQGTHAS